MHIHSRNEESRCTHQKRVKFDCNGMSFFFTLIHETYETWVCEGVGGGAWYPPAQGALADRANTRRSYLVPVSGYIAMTIYAIGLVVDQAGKDGFRVRNVDELAVPVIAAADPLPPGALVGDGTPPSQLKKQIYEYERANEDSAEKVMSET